MTNQLKSHSKGKSLDEWLSYLESIHNTEIDLGLERIGKVAKALSLDLSTSVVITVAGTNGKGTTCAFMENAIRQLGKSVAVYSSPHIERFTERLRVNFKEVDDRSFVQAFEQIEKARKEISLTYYEYTTLAAFLILEHLKPEYIILEVGLGGRLDATNLIDSNIAAITSVDLDHQAFLGDTRELIGFEKAGVFRKNCPAVVGDIEPPQSVLKHVENIESQLCLRGRDFSIAESNNEWSYSFKSHEYHHLPFPNIPLDNVATALTVLNLLELPLTEDLVKTVILETKVPGRTELFTLPCHTLVDVGHNPLAARYLARYIESMKVTSVKAVVGMLSDKDISSTLHAIQPIVNEWYFASLDVPRGATEEHLAGMINVGNSKINCFDKVIDAYKMACNNIAATELVLVFGSFFTVAEIRPLLIENNTLD